MIVPCVQMILFFIELNFSELKMSGLVPKTRVAWALAVVKVNGVNSLHLIKRNYRGQLSYYSKSARGVTKTVLPDPSITPASGASVSRNNHGTVGSQARTRANTEPNDESV